MVRAAGGSIKQEDIVKKILAAFLFGLIFCFWTRSAAAQLRKLSPGSYGGYLVDNPGLAFNDTYTLDLSQYDAARVSAQVLYSSATFAAVTFSSSDYQLGGSEILAPNHGLPLALPVLYAVGSGAAINGLTGGTTYYIIPAAKNYIELSTTSALAQAGDFVTLNSSSTSSQSYSLTPLAIAGTPSFEFQVSNDGSDFLAAPSTGTVSIASYSNPAADIIVDFGYLNYRYLRLNVTAPTAGALMIDASVIAKHP